MFRFTCHPDGGESFEAPIQLDDAGIEPLVSMARHPYVFANDQRVGVTFNDQAKFNLARLASTNGAVSGIRNAVVEGDILSSVTQAASRA